MAAKGAIAAGKIKRIAVIGPGLDFTDKRDGYAMYPPKGRASGTACLE